MISSQYLLIFAGMREGSICYSKALSSNQVAETIRNTHMRACVCVYVHVCVCIHTCMYTCVCVTVCLYVLTLVW